MNPCGRLSRLIPWCSSPSNIVPWDIIYKIIRKQKKGKETQHGRDGREGRERKIDVSIWIFDLCRIKAEDIEKYSKSRF